MNSKNKVILFIPVSSTSGIGEYSRSLVIAEELERQFPNIKIHFLLNKHAKYSETCHFQTHLSDGSATKDSAKVKSVIDNISPDLVIFDCSGRASHFKYAKKSGAKVIFISQHEKKRARGLGLTRLLNSDRQWVAQTLTSIKPLGWIQRTKLKLLGKMEPKIIGPIFKIPKKIEVETLLKTYHLQRNQFILFNAGSGGHLVNEKLASELFFDVANEISRSLDIKCIVVFGANFPKKLPMPFIENETQENIKPSPLICIREIDNHLFIGLLNTALCAVLAGGDTLLQTIELNTHCVTTPISKDQPKRIKSAAHLPQIFPTACNKVSLIDATKNMLQNIEQGDKTHPVEVNDVTECLALNYALSDIRNLLQLQ